MNAYQQARHEWVNPHTVIWANNPVNRDAVEHYKRHPNQPYQAWGDGDGDPLIIRTPTGELVGCNGKHRAIAAAETGRKLWARVYHQPNPPGAAGPALRRRRGRVESNDIELMYTVAGNALRCGYLLAGATERVYARDQPHTVTRVPGWEDDAVHQLLDRRWLTRGSTQPAICGSVRLTGTTVLVPPATRNRVHHQRHLVVL